MNCLHKNMIPWKEGEPPFYKCEDCGQEWKSYKELVESRTMADLAIRKEKSESNPKPKANETWPQQPFSPQLEKILELLQDISVDLKKLLSKGDDGSFPG